MEITREMLVAERQNLAVQRDKLWNAFNQANGAFQAVEQLIAVIDKKEEEPTKEPEETQPTPTNDPDLKIQEGTGDGDPQTD